MKIGLEVRAGRAAAIEFADRLAERLTDLGADVVGTEHESDLVISVGGDGTMLAAVRRALTHDVPVLGFNLGTIGFLADAEPETLDEVAGRLAAGDFEVEERMTVMADVEGVTATGVNDVVVEKVDSQRLVSLLVTVDGHEFVTYRADGIIVSTPTGSTAYSFSAGGPLVDPALEALIMTPVAAHSLFDRTIVLPKQSKIQVTINRDRPVNVTVDKCNLGQLDEGEVVTIGAGARNAKFVQLFNRPFTDSVKGKFGL